jgi:CRISPR system Cascade subunit CasA
MRRRRRKIMEEKEFNLLDEPWIRVLTDELVVKEVSVKDILGNAHSYRQLAGEMPTMDIAIMRFLLAIVETVFYRYSLNGEYYELTEENDCEPEDAMERWKEYWNEGHFNKEIFENYLEEYRERFWLFHPETPFFQVPNLQYGTEYNAVSLLGNIKESNNSKTKHHFSMREAEYLEKQDYASAARWLIHYNAFTVNIKADKEAPGTTLPVGVGRLGQLGLIKVIGNNIFESLMLNMVALNNDELWGLPKPVWEKGVSESQGCNIVQPDNLPELYTIQSRRVTLIREYNDVRKFKAIGGEFYSTEDDFVEPMTLWSKRNDKKSQIVSYVPKKHSMDVQVWREFASIFNISEQSGHIPGIVLWVRNLIREGIINNDNPVSFNMIGMVYGDGMSYTYGDCVDDQISLVGSLLLDVGDIWRQLIIDEIDKCKKVAEFIGYFASDITKIYYGSEKNKQKSIKNKLISQYYSRMDSKFRMWLLSINPKKEGREDKLNEWEKISYYTAVNVIEEYVAELSNVIAKYKDDDKTMNILSVPLAFNNYINRLRTVYNINKDNK